MIKCKAENQNQKCRFFKNMYPSSWSVNVLQGAKSNYFTSFSTHKKLSCLCPPSSQAFSHLIPLFQTFIGSKIDRKSTNNK